MLSPFLRRCEFVQLKPYWGNGEMVIAALGCLLLKRCKTIYRLALRWADIVDPHQFYEVAAIIGSLMIKVLPFPNSLCT